MKKLIAIAVTVVMVIAAFAMVGPVSANPPANPAVFESDIVARPDVTGCVHVAPLDEGEVKVFADGSVEVKIKGALANQTYDVILGQTYYYEPPEVWKIKWIHIGQFPTNVNGDGEHTFDAGTISTPVYSPIIAINIGTGPCTNRYITGF